MPPTTPIADHAVATLTIPGYADFLVADGQAVWVTNTGRIEKLEHDHAAPVASVPMPAPTGVMAFGFGSVWVANSSDTSLYRVDPTSLRVIAAIPTGLADPGGELRVATGFGSVWLLTDPSSVLSRVDPRTDQVIAHIGVAPFSYAAACGYGAVWVTNTGEVGTDQPGAVQRIDPNTNAVVETITVGRTPRFLTTGEGAVWVLNQGDGSVSRIDPETNRVVATIAIPGAAGAGGDIDAGAGRVWVRTTNTLLSAIDPTKDVVTEQFGPSAGSGAVRVANNRIWVTAHDIETVWVLRP